MSKKTQGLALKKSTAQRKLSQKRRKGTYYAKVARIPIEQEGDTKVRKTYTKLVTVKKADRLIYGVPTYDFKHHDEQGRQLREPVMYVRERTPLSRQFVRAKVSA